jgi:hypothetical protein
VTTLADLVRVQSRFSRSANVERDSGLAAFDGYLPTGRALDVVGRVARGLADASAGRAFSITGPHGSGKSSLAVFLNALFSSAASDVRTAAFEALARVSQETADQLAASLAAGGSAEQGPIRAFVTANREPLTVTIARALLEGARRTLGPEQDVVPESFGRPEVARSLTSRDIKEVIEQLCAAHVVLLVIDEFGKNLESYAQGTSESDPYLLQELAEASQGQRALPLVIVTLQHLSFDEYVQDASHTKRREWAKVLGRFQDIPYVETATQARRLMSAVVSSDAPQLKAAQNSWCEQHAALIERSGLKDLIAEPLMAYPLHPLTLAVLPDLCSRYGQNERTLFSFLAGSEPLAVPSFLGSTKWSEGSDLPLVGLDRVYDYFLDSASSMIGASDSVSRWVEIETRIRDVVGLDDRALRTLKSIGVLNLVSSAGSLRASRSVIALAVAPEDGISSIETQSLDEVLSQLENAGLITYRDFADEYRVWQGSDFDMRGAIEMARRSCEDKPLAQLLADVVNLGPAVAGRHSQQTGVLRVFQQLFAEPTAEHLAPAPTESPWDGLVVYATSTSLASAPTIGRQEKPVVVVIPSDVESVRSTAVEAAALRQTLDAREASRLDWVARRELTERAAVATQRVKEVVASTWNADSTWHVLGRQVPLKPQAGLSAVLSQVADVAYSATPNVANEMIARRELTSQGAKARRLLLEALLARPDAPAFGITGYGPERAMYEAIFNSTGLHRPSHSGEWAIGRPKPRAWREVWNAIEGVFGEAKTRRINLQEAASKLKCPPYGLKDGLIPVLLIAALTVHEDELALYEHGSLVLVLDDAVMERMTRNLGHFTIKNLASNDEDRAAIISALMRSLGVQRGNSSSTFLHAARRLYREVMTLPAYTQQTKKGIGESAAAVRQAFRTAGEPDVLVFETLPEILGFAPFRAGADASVESAQAYAEQLAGVLEELRRAYPRLLERVASDIAAATAVSGVLPELRDRLTGQAVNLQDRVLEPRLKAFVNAIGRPLDAEDWLENLAMVIAGGRAPRSWTDDEVAAFGMRVRELGGALRRTQALLYDRLASSDAGFVTSRITVTQPDGRETAEVLVLSEQDKKLADQHLLPVIETLTTILGSRSSACRTLLARLAMDDQPTAPMAPSGDVRLQATPTEGAAQ